MSIRWPHDDLGNAMLGLDQKDKALDHLITAFHMSARYEGNPLAVGRAVSKLRKCMSSRICIGNLPKAKEHKIVLGHAIYGNDLQGQVCACGNIGNIYMSLKEPVKAMIKVTRYHNRGCSRFDVAKCQLQHQTQHMPSWPSS